MNDRGDSVAGSAFRKEYRLRTPAEYAGVFSARRVLRGRLFALHYRFNDSCHGARLGLVIPKKQARTAVLRNAIKRQARECFRQRRSQLPALDLVLRLAQPITGHGSAADPSFRAAWRADIDALLDGLREVKP